jgi:hypothetical protein
LAAGPLQEQNKHRLVERATGLCLKSEPGSAVAYVEKVPVKFGQLGRLSGLYFGCTGCARGTLFTAIELVKLYGTEGRVADLAKRLSCKFCKQHRKRPPRVYVEVSRPFYTNAEVAALKATNLDALVFSLEKLRPSKKVS